MPARVVVIKRVRHRSFALLRAAPGWIGSVWAAWRGTGALRTESLSPLAESCSRDAGIPALAFSASGAHRCTGCDLCVQLCPSRALRLDRSAGETDGWEVTRFELAVGACIGCGRCVEECPEDALEMRRTPSFAVAQRSGSPVPIDLLARGGARG